MMMILNKEKDETEQLKKLMTQLPVKETLHLNKNAQVTSLGLP